MSMETSIFFIAFESNLGYKDTAFFRDNQIFSRKYTKTAAANPFAAAAGISVEKYVNLVCD